MSENIIARSSINLMQNQLKNAAMHKLKDAPENPVEGQFYFNTEEKKPFYFDGADWIALEDKNYTYEQGTPSELWTIIHPLKKKVSVTITDSAGTVVIGKVTINNGEMVVVEFGAPFSGYAELN